MGGQSNNPYEENSLNKIESLNEGILIDIEQISSDSSKFNVDDILV